MIFKRYFCIYICLVLAACVSTPKGPDLSALTCEQQFSVAQKAHEFGAINFDKAYSNDLRGAETQLFLIKEKAPSNFAANYNAAEASFNQNLIRAQERGCDMSNYPTSPIRVFESKLNTLKASTAK